MPVYNCQNYIDRCLESIIAQSYVNFEIIIINDGSTDDSLAVCQSYGDKRIKIIDSEHRGVSIARNIGIENSRGDFIFFIDADDFIEKNALKLLISEEGKADWIIGNFKKIKKDGSVAGSGNDKVFSASKLLNKQDIIIYTREYLKRPNRLPLFDNCWGRLFKSSIIKNNKLFYDEDLRTSEDIAFNFKYLKYVERVFFVDQPIYNHIVWDNYSSASLYFEEPSDLFGYRKAFVEVADFLKSRGLGDNIYNEIAHAYVSYTIVQLIRFCGQINKNNQKNIYGFISNLVNEKKLRDSLLFYAPKKGESKIIPVLIKLKLIWPIIWVCKYKADKRYKK